jgi:hypothetical protein
MILLVLRLKEVLRAQLSPQEPKSGQGVVDVRQQDDYGGSGDSKRLVECCVRVL